MAVRRCVVLGIAGSLAAAGAAFLAIVVAKSLPKRSGRIEVAGLSAPVRVVRDRFGVPHVHAEGVEDLFFAQGYVTAQDRLWQMEFQRRVGRGTLAELLGEAALPADRLLRTVGFRPAAERSWRELSPEGRRLVTAYTRGANAVVASGLVPLEFRILRARPQPFDEIDALTWPKLMAWDLDGNATSEIERAVLTRRWGRKKADQFLVPPPDSPVIVPDAAWEAAIPPAERGSSPAAPGGSDPGVMGSAVPTGFGLFGPERFGLRELFEPRGSVEASNSWVIAGSRTTTGRPILCNDPHLRLRAPSLWYLIELSAPGLHAEGASIPGIPGVILGRNDRIAWGLTNIGADVQDLYVEKTDPADPDDYFFRGEKRRFSSRTEMIPVRGKTPFRLTVRESVHGPIITDVLRGARSLGPATALRWTAIDPSVPDRSAEAFFGLMRAGDWNQFLAAVSKLSAPEQNFVYADADGHIGYTASGAIPIRPRASGLLPVSGEGVDEWSGFIPFSDLPRVLDPPDGFLVTANNAVVSNRYPWPISRDWAEPYRAIRIAERIRALSKASPQDVAAIQSDRVSLLARDLLPLLLPCRPLDPMSGKILERLRRWNFDMQPNSPEAAMFGAWYAELTKLPGNDLRDVGISVRSRLLLDAFAGKTGDIAWCDDPTTSAVEGCSDFAARALARAARLLQTRLGNDPDKWRWGAIHHAIEQHAAFGNVAVLRKLFNLECPVGGDKSTVDVGGFSTDGSFAVTHAPSYRQVVDFSDPAGSLFVQTTGQSGNPLERAYRDQLPVWNAGRYAMMGREPSSKVLELAPPGR
jgi:penicillin amidase